MAANQPPQSSPEWGRIAWTRPELLGMRTAHGRCEHPGAAVVATAAAGAGVLFWTVAGLWLAIWFAQVWWMSLLILGPSAQLGLGLIRWWTYRAPEMGLGLILGTALMVPLPLYLLARVAWQFWLRWEAMGG